MKREKRTEVAFPLKITLDTGESIIVPRQGKYKNSWLRKHGCPFTSQYEVFQWLGIKPRKSVSDIHNWCRKNIPSLFKATLTMKGCRSSVNHFIKGYGKAKFYAPKDITVTRLTKFLKAGAMIIITRRKPSIHYYVVFMENGKIYALNYSGGGNCKQYSADFIVKTRCFNSRYGGMIVITKPKKPAAPKKTTTPKKDTTPAKKPTATKTTGSQTKKVTKKVVDDVINGKYGNGDARKKALEKAGYSYREVQDAVNKRLK